MNYNFHLRVVHVAFAFKGDLCERMYSRRPLQYSSAQLNDRHKFLSSKDSSRVFVDDLRKLQNEKQKSKQSETRDDGPFISPQMKGIPSGQTIVHTLTPVSCGGGFVLFLFQIYSKYISHQGDFNNLSFYGPS